MSGLFKIPNFNRRARGRRYQAYLRGEKLGDCTACKVGFPAEGRSMCAECLSKAADTNARTYAKKRAMGICRRCSSQSIPGTSRCGNHTRRLAK